MSAAIDHHSHYQEHDLEEANCSKRRKSSSSSNGTTTKTSKSQSSQRQQRYEQVSTNEEEASGGGGVVVVVPPSRERHANANTIRCNMIGVCLLLLFVTMTILLSIDMFVVVPQQQGGGNRKWIPIQDILYSSPNPTTQDGSIDDDIKDDDNYTLWSSQLKYVRDVANYPLQGLAIARITASSSNTTATEDYDNDDDGNLLLLYEFHTFSARILELEVVDADSDNNVLIVRRVRSRRIYNNSTTTTMTSTSAANFPIIFQQPVTHIGGIDVATSTLHGTEVWIATHSEGTDGEGALFAVDPTTLDIIRHRAIRVPYNLDWVAYQNDILYFGTFFNVTSVKRVVIDTLEQLPDMPLTNLPTTTTTNPSGAGGTGLNYIQSGAFDPISGNLILLSDDYQCTIYVIDVTTGKVVNSQALLLGSETDGITFDPITNSMLVGFNRQHSHEQVMGQDPMISIIQLQQHR